MKKWTLWFAFAALLMLPACGGDDNKNDNNGNNGSNNGSNNNGNGENNGENGENNGGNGENNGGNGENNGGNGENNGGNGENNDKLVCDNATTKAKCQTLNGNEWAFACNNGVVSEESALNCTEDGFTCFTDDDTNPTEAWCGCTANAQCAALYPEDAPFCNINIHSCAQCLTSDDCGQNEICDEEGSCVPGTPANSISCEGLTDYYNCKTDGNGHDWLVLCQDGQIVEVSADDPDTKTMDCTAAGSKCVDGWFGSKMCGCIENEDCASNVCSASGRCEPVNENVDPICKGRENLGFCTYIDDVLNAVNCYNGVVLEDWSFECNYDGDIYCDTYDPGDGDITAYCTDKPPVVE